MFFPRLTTQITAPLSISARPLQAVTFDAQIGHDLAARQALPAGWHFFSIVMARGSNVMRAARLDGSCRAAVNPWATYVAKDYRRHLYRRASRALADIADRIHVPRLPEESARKLPASTRGSGRGGTMPSSLSESS